MILFVSGLVLVCGIFVSSTIGEFMIPFVAGYITVYGGARILLGE